jgi:hypothetical protein
MLQKDSGVERISIGRVRVILVGGKILSKFRAKKSRILKWGHFGALV